MNLDDLKVIRNEERRSRRLTQLKNSFYFEFKEYMDSLKTSDDPQKKDELENALQVADAIYDKRAAKIIKLAALAARGHREDVSLADAEAEVYDLVYKVFTHYRDRVLGQMEFEPLLRQASQCYQMKNRPTAVHCRNRNQIALSLTLRVSNSL